VTRSAIRQEERRWRRGDLLAIAAAVALGAAFAWILLTIQGMNNDLRAKDTDIAALAQQVKGLGGTPVAGPSGSPGKAGTAGARGPRGPRGATGASGKPAPTITPSPGPSGASGAPGKNGADSTVPGPSGSPGADSTVPGPPGPPGPAGQDGSDGVDGKDGSDGKPPASWRFTYFGTTYTCRPVDDFDEQNPQYDCQPDQPGNGNGGGNSSNQAAALDPSRRQYV
jgi:hypothetical protein